MANKGLSLAYDSPLGDIEKRLDELRYQACYIAEQGVVEARSKEKDDDWDDQTGNLRSSIGCVVTDNGETLQSSTPQLFKNGSEGVSEGLELLNKLRGEPSSGLKIDMCAGMNYASFVQDRHKKNVLISARLKVETMFRKALEKLCK